MPLITEQDARDRAVGLEAAVTITGSDTTPQEQRPSLSETFKAAFRTENTIGSFWAQEDGLPGWMSGVNMEFDFEPFIADTKYSDYANEFVYAQDEDDINIIKKQIDRELEDRKTLQSSGAMGFVASITSAVADPINLIPVGGQVARGVRVGQNVYRMGVGTAKAGFAGATIAEVGLQATQTLRTAEESAINIAAGTVFSGFLGAGVGIVKELAGTPALTKSYDDLVKDFVDETQSVDLNPTSSLGAMQVDRLPSMDDLTPSFDLGVGKTISRLPVFGDDKSMFDPFNNPDIRIHYNSMSVNAKMTMHELSPTSIRLNGHDTGNFVSPVAADTLITMKQMEFLKSPLQELDKSKNTHRKLVSEGKAPKINEAEINRDIYLAIHFGKISELPETMRPAAEAVKESFKPVTKELIEIDRLPKDYVAPDGQVNYLPVIMNTPVIKQDTGEFVDLIYRQMTRNFERLANNIEQIKSNLQSKQQDIKEINSIKDIIKETTRRDALNRATEAMLSDIDALKAYSLNDDFFATVKKLSQKKSSQKKFSQKKFNAEFEKEFSQLIKDELSAQIAEQSSRRISALSKEFEGFAGEVSLEDIPLIDIDPLFRDMFDTDALNAIVEKAKAKATKSVKEKAAEVEDLTPDQILDLVLQESRKVTRENINKSIDEKLKPFNEKIDELTKDLRKIQAEYRKAEFGAMLDPADINHYASRLRNRIIGFGGPRDISEAAFDLSEATRTKSGASSLKARTFEWDDDLFAEAVEKEFIQTDIERIITNYSRTVIPDIQMVKQFGDYTGDKRLAKINDEYTKMRSSLERKLKAAPEGEKKKIEKQIKKLVKQQRSDNADIKLTFDRMTGRFDNSPDHLSSKKFISNLKNFNIMRHMGQVVGVSIPDVARLAIAARSLPVFRDTYKNIAKIANPMGKFRGQAKHEANVFNQALNTTMASRAHALYDLSDNIFLDNKKSFTDKLAEAVSRFFTHNGMNYWNDTMQSAASTTIADNIYVRAARVASGKGKRGDIGALAQGGIDKETAGHISDMVKKYGFMDGAIQRVDMDAIDFDDPNMLKAFEAVKNAVHVEVDRVIINPTPGERPIFLSSQVGGLVGQYKSFGYASLQKSALLFAQGLSRNPKDFALWTSMVMQVSLGMLVTAGRLATRGDFLAVAGGWGVARWVAEGVDRSGLAGSLTDNYNVLNSITGSALAFAGGQGLSAITGEDIEIQPLTRYSQRNVFDRVLGPTAGLMADIPMAGSGLAHTVFGHKPTQSEISSFRRLFPYNNLIGLNGILNFTEEEMAEEFNLPKSRSFKRGSSKLQR